MATATGKVSKSPERHPARTPEEIGARLYSLAEKIERRGKKGRTLTAEEAVAIAKRIRSYAVRLRPASDESTTVTVKLPHREMDRASKEEEETESFTVY